MEDVDAERDVSDDVRDRDGYASEARDHVVVHLAAYELGVGLPEGEVEQVEDHEQSDDHTGPSHRP
jgi:hypothetical protein